MSKKANPQKKILLDCDVIRHLIKADRLSLLSELYDGRLIILDVVKKELLRSSHLVMIVSNFIQFFHIEEMSFPTDRIEVLKEFASLKRRYGDGESACMAVARFDDNIIASSNLRDIETYCSENNIEYLTTMDIILEGFENGKFTKDEADAMIRTIKQKNSKLP
ncbi:MAG: hypothetical protein FK734_13495, partial [Asgard group archaeon]|nr:hypothetical protein [Asgard group archaeon]